jgi:CRP/FNR family transcriptional regulator, cyclic AMP receptor protein
MTNAVRGRIGAKARQGLGGSVGYQSMLAMRRRKRASTFDPRAFLAGIATGKSSRDYRQGQDVFVQGDAADAIFYIQTGKVKLTVVSTRGKEAMIAILGRGDFFGEGSLAGQPLRISTAASIQLSSIVRVDKKAMAGLLRREPEFARLFTAYMLLRNVRIEEDLVDQLFDSSEKRLACVLLLLAHFGKLSKPQAVVPKISQDILASMVGTTRAKAGHLLGRFRKRGFIDYDGDGMRVHRGLLGVVLG